MSQQKIYDFIKSANNKELWALSKELNDFRRKEKKKPKTTDKVDLENKEGLRQDVLQHLYAESSKGNAQASDKLAKLAGLTEESANIIIESVDFGKVVWDKNE
tara:strand:+ start:89 stop:397 length:309 start_codon:yes stop_codon:yes gene_type:complete